MIFLKNSWNENNFIFLKCIIILENYNFIFTLVENAGMALSEVGLQNCFLWAKCNCTYLQKWKILNIYKERELRLKNGRANF